MTTPTLDQVIALAHQLPREQGERSAAVVATRTPAEALADLQPPRAAPA